MQRHLIAIAGLALGLSLAQPAAAEPAELGEIGVQLGPRPLYLVDQLSDGPLKDTLDNCARRKKTFEPSNFSIGHRGAPLRFPEHTLESYLAAANMGAGVIECDVTFTRDRELVCRHAQCDLHTTTDIAATPLAGKCRVPPVLAADGTLTNAADIRCCASDITLAEFKRLQGKMDAADKTATSIEAYLAETPDDSTGLPAGAVRGTLLTHAESIALFKQLGVGMTPELKSPEVPMPYEGDYTQEDYAGQMVAEYRAADVAAHRVWAQSFNYADVLYWVKEHPEFGRQAVFLDDRYRTDVTDPKAVAALSPTMSQVAADGVNIIAPPMFMLLQTAGDDIVPSAYAVAAKGAGLDIISWTTERSGALSRGGGGFYYQTVAGAIENDGDILTIIDALAQDVGIIGLFSDWPATTTFYANCMETAAPRAPPSLTSIRNPTARSAAAHGSSPRGQ